MLVEAGFIKFQVKEESLNPVLNRDLSRRVRAVSGIAQHTPCARVDLRNVTQLIERLDSKWKVWIDNDVRTIIEV